MKRVIGGKQYNTETAKLVGNWTNGLNPTDYLYGEERLYRTRSGCYFLHCYGCPRSKSNPWESPEEEGLEKILPLNFQQAEQWARESLSIEGYQTAFGNTTSEETDEEKVILSVSVPKRTRDLLQREKEKTGKSISAIITECVDHGLES